jgi:hypothetical protein
MARSNIVIRDVPEAHYLINFFNKIRIDDSTGCWNWSSATNKDGYGNYCYKSKQISSHIYSMKVFLRYEEGKLVDHICQNRKCCNPDHLRMVDHRTNAIENSKSPPAINAAKTYCKYNHPYNEKNTGWTIVRGIPRRNCLQCKRERKASYKKKEEITDH